MAARVKGRATSVGALFVCVEYDIAALNILAKQYSLRDIVVRCVHRVKREGVRACRMYDLLQCVGGRGGGAARYRLSLLKGNGHALSDKSKRLRCTKDSPLAPCQSLILQRVTYRNIAQSSRIVCSTRARAV